MDRETLKRIGTEGLWQEDATTPSVPFKEPLCPQCGQDTVVTYPDPMIFDSQDHICKNPDCNHHWFSRSN